jgi:hypothetical protein
MQHAVNVTDTSARAAAGSSENDGGGLPQPSGRGSSENDGGSLPQPSQQIPSSAQAAQEKGVPGKHQEEAWDEEDLEDEVIERLHQEQEIITRRQAAAQHENTIHLLYTYFNRKRRLHVNSLGLEILTLIREKIIITHQCHYIFW